MSSGKKRHLSQSPHRSSEHKCKSLHEGKRGKYTRDESESSSRSSSISSSDASPERKSHRKKKDRKRKHRHRSSSSDSSSPKQKKKKKEKKKKKDKKKKKKKLKTEKHKKEEKMCKTPVNSMNSAVNQSNKRSDSQLAAGPSPPVMKPMTKEEWEKQQSIVRRVYDPETGRNRLVKGDGEIIEEIVSKDRHRDINKQATRGDSAFYQATLGIQDK